jgi:phospho-N-acetylmuramoyl-pentapeptide-transferase
MTQELFAAGGVFVWSAGLCAVVTRLLMPTLAQAQGAAPARYDDCPPLASYQQAKRHVPTMGGVGVLLCAGLVAGWAGGLAQWQGWVVAAAAAAFGALGLADDWLKFRRPQQGGVRCLPKLLIALVLGSSLGVTMLAGPSDTRTLHLPGLGRLLVTGWWWVPLAMCVIAGCAHAVNLTDGMDGLAAGCVAMAAMGIGVLAFMEGGRQPALVAWCVAVSGACVGFLWFNSYPAAVFLGDVGALGLGAALGTISVLAGASAWLLLIGGVFVAEALSVMLQVASYKWRGKRRIFRVAPLHHHFQVGGMSEPKVVLRLWMVAAMLALLGVLWRGASP